MQQFLKSNSIWKNVLIWLAFLLVIVAIYYPTIHTDPLWDDWFFLFRSKTIRQGDISEFWSWGYRGRAWPMFYTVASLMYKNWGSNYLYYHLTNILLHSFNCFLIYRILNKLKSSYAFFISMIYLVHPLNFFTVFWIIQIKTLLAIFFFLISLDLFLRSEESKSPSAYWVSVVMFAFSLLSKAVFVPIALLMPLYFKRTRLLPFFLLCVFSAGLTLWTPHIKKFIKTTSIVNYVISSSFANQEKVIPPIRSRPMVPIKELRSLYPLEESAIAIKNFSKYLVFVFYPWETLLVQPKTYFNYENTDFVISIFTVFGILFLFFKTLKDSKNLFLIGACFFTVTLLPLCGFMYIPIFHYTSFVDYWLSVPALGLLLSLSRLPKNIFITAILSLFITFLTYKSILVAQKSTDAVSIINESSKVSPGHPLIKLILAFHYFHQEKYEESNKIMFDVRKNYNIDIKVLDSQIENNNRAINGEEIDKFY